jgi:2-keto-4-pentenoate hydratase
MIEDTTKIIIDSRRNNTLIPDLLNYMPKNVDEAYLIQDEVVKSFDYNSIGWKVGCTTEMAQKFSGMTEPFSGIMFDETTFLTSNLDIKCVMNKPIIEPELCFEIGENIIDIGELYNKENILKYIKSIFPVIEIVDARYQKGWDIKALETISDNGVHSILVKGEKISDWNSYDRLNSIINLYVDNKLICSGRGSNVLNDPLNSICWLANKLIARGKFIKAGEIITTGNTLDKPIFAKPNTLIFANFEGLGDVRMKYY